MIAEKRQKLLAFWTRHIEKKRTTDVTRAAYCRANDLDHHQMIYWERRLASIETENTSRSPGPGGAFAKAVVDDKSGLQPIIPTAGNNNFRLKFPCGLVLELDGASDPVWAAKLIRAISGGRQ
jgi:hypothetical protein